MSNLNKNNLEINKQSPNISYQAVIIILHGLSFSWNKKTANKISETISSIFSYNTKLIFPQAPIIFIDDAEFNLERKRIPSWYNIASREDLENGGNDRGMIESIKWIEEIIKEEIDKGILSRNIFVFGISQGGSMALAIAMSSQYELGGFISIAGYVPYPKVIKKIETEKNKKSLILMAHGEEDKKIPYKKAQQSWQTLKENGYQIKPLKVHSVGHEIQDLFRMSSDNLSFFKDIFQSKDLIKLNSVSWENFAIIKIDKKNWPATLYVEGSDQFRGWFNSSLITAVILANNPPYQQVLSHGFVVDEKGHKMSKSLGNVIDPEELLKKYGVDILRLWVVSSDFTKEVKVSNSILENVQENYQKIRNTLRFLLANLSHLPVSINSEQSLKKDLDKLDYYILEQLEKLLLTSKDRYSSFNFNAVYVSLLRFCINKLSSFYLETVKDSLYCDQQDSQRRQQIIITFYHLLHGLLKILSPLLPHLAEEIYQYLPFNFGFGSFASVQLLPTVFLPNFTAEIKKENEVIEEIFLPLRQEVLKFLEKARQEKIITNNRQVNLFIYFKQEKNLEKLATFDLAKWLGVTFVTLEKIQKDSKWKESENYFFKVEKSVNEPCQRCQNYQNLTEGFCVRCYKIIFTN